MSLYWQAAPREGSAFCNPIHLKAFTYQWIEQQDSTNKLIHFKELASRWINKLNNTNKLIHFKAFTSRWIKKQDNVGA